MTMVIIVKIGFHKTESEGQMEAYLEDNRPTIDEVCESYFDKSNECNKECPLYRFCHPQAESEEMNGKRKQKTKMP